MKQKICKERSAGGSSYAPARALVVLLICLTGVLLATADVTASAPTSVAAQEGETPQEGEEGVSGEELGGDCQSCHLDVTAHWETSAHANAYADPVFQQQWATLGQPDDCLRCHTTSFEPATGEFSAEGVACEACHGAPNANHPEEAMPILAGANECGDCHTTTLGEWHGSGHAAADVDCMSCHNPHNQQPLFADADAMCLNCHEDTMGDYLEDIHYSQDIGCVDCHALVIPPDVPPEDGIVPTGHGFTITPATCVACHTDALHSGFSLPGYEHGATTAEEGEVVEPVGFVPPASGTANGANGNGQAATEQQIQVLEAALASNRVTTLFQGALVGLTFGGVTAWFVASNLRARQEHEDEGDDEEA